MEKKFPDLNSFNTSPDGARLVRELTSTIQRLYDYADDLERRLNEKIAKESSQTLEKFKTTSELVNSFATNLIGVANPPNPLTGLGTGTVVSVTAGSGLSGGTFSDSGTIALIIGTSNVIQKSDGSKLVNSQITDDGSTIIFVPVVGQIFNAGGADPSGIAYQNDQSFIGDWNGAGNGTFLEIKDALNGLFILHNLPTADPGVSGALWNNGGVINVSP